MVTNCIKVLLIKIYEMDELGIWKKKNRRNMQIRWTRKEIGKYLIANKEKIGKEITQENFKEIESTIGLKFPNNFKEFMLEKQANRIELGDFAKEWKEKYGTSPTRKFYEKESFGSFSGFIDFAEVEYYIYVLYYGWTRYPEGINEDNKYGIGSYYYPNEILPFAEFAGGLLCFDLRSLDRENPSVVLCRSGYGPDDFGRIMYIADNFEELLSMLGRPDREAKGPESVTGEEWYQ